MYKFCILSHTLSLFALLYLEKRNLIFKREGFLFVFFNIPKCTWHHHFSISVSHVLVQAKLESYLNFPHGLLNLMDRHRACDNIPRRERQKGILPIIVSENKTLSFGKESLETPSISLEASLPGPAEASCGCWKALCGPCFLRVQRLQVLNSLFQMLMAIYLCLYSAQTSRNSKLQTSFYS